MNKPTISDLLESIAMQVAKIRRYDDSDLANLGEDFYLFIAQADDLLDDALVEVEHAQEDGRIG
jgi:hypothetical protein